MSLKVVENKWRDKFEIIGNMVKFVGEDGQPTAIFLDRKIEKK